jgi:prevent-host-death family protein
MLVSQLGSSGNLYPADAIFEVRSQSGNFDDLDMRPTKIHLFTMKDTYSIKDLQRETAAAIHAAESGTLVTVTRHDRPVVHVISAARLGGILETMELLADADFTRQFRLLRARKLKFHPASSLAD